MPKILVIRFSSIGDIVLASPVFRCIKMQVADAEIHFLTKAAFKPVTEANPYIDKFHYLGKDLQAVIDDLKNENFDHIIDLHNNFRSIKVRKALRGKVKVIDKLNIEKFLLTKLSINVMPGRHITLRSLDTVKHLGVNDDGGGLDYFIPEREVVKESDIPTSHQAGYVAVVIGGSYHTKKMPTEKLVELCRLLDFPIMLLGGPEDREAGQIIAMQDEVKIYNACGKFTLNESADLIRRSKLVISHDTGLQYIACAFGKQVLAIWGGTSPKLDVEPFYGTNFKNSLPYPVYENIYLNLRCQPCSKYGTDTCPLIHFNCMRKLDVSLIVQKAHTRLGK